jgi:predicted HicB family RNase H-like nuclease
MMVDKYDYRVIWSEQDQCYLASVLEFPSLAAHGDTPYEALKEIQFVVSEVLKDLEEQGEVPPEPISLRNYSGRLNLRMPEYLHKELAREAARQKVSLNQLILLKLVSNIQH